MVLNGADISHWNKNYEDIIDDNDFIIIKATEGSSFKDPQMVTAVNYANNKNKLIGLYHFARPKINTAEKEAQHFLDVVKDYIGKAVLVLDWEGEAWTSDQNWARKWLDYIYNQTGIRPLIYTSEAYVNKVGKAVADGNYGLWVAKYSSKEPKIAPWKFKALWQYISKPYDKDYFYGTKNAWKKYAKGDNK